MSSAEETTRRGVTGSTGTGLESGSGNHENDPLGRIDDAIGNGLLQARDDGRRLRARKDSLQASEGLDRRQRGRVADRHRCARGLPEDVQHRAVARWGDPF